jgi:hypothetical protein
MRILFIAAILLVSISTYVCGEDPFPMPGGDTQSNPADKTDPFKDIDTGEADTGEIPFMSSDDTASIETTDMGGPLDTEIEVVDEATGGDESITAVQPEGIANPNVFFYRGWKYDHKRNILGVGKINTTKAPTGKHYQFLTLGGKLLEIKQYGLGRKLDKAHKYSFGPSGLKKAVTTRDAKGKITQKGVIEYDQDERRSTEKYYRADDSLIIEYKYEYDEKGKLVRIAGYDPSGKLKKSTEIKNDDRGNPIELKSFKGKNIRQTEKIGYDDQNREISRKIYDERGKQTESTNYEYDERGNRVSKISEETLLSTEDREYNAAQRKKGLVVLDGQWMTPAERDRLISEQRKYAEKAMEVHDTSAGDQTPLPPFDSTGTESTPASLPPMPGSDAGTAPGMPN